MFFHKISPEKPDKTRYFFPTHATEDQQVDRILNRDKDLKIDQVKNRIRAQIPIEKKVKLADVKIDNSGEINAWKQQIDDLVKNWEEKEPRFGDDWREAGAYVVITVLACTIAAYLF